jgi:hypothetical protein
MSTDYSKMSDFEINLRVAEIAVDYDCISRLPYNDMAVYWGDGANWHAFNPCNNPADAWPIISGNRISIMFDQSTEKKRAEAVKGFAALKSQTSPMFAVETNYQKDLAALNAYAISNHHITSFWLLGVFPE